MTTVREMNLTFSAKTGICDMASKWHGQPCPLCGLGTLHAKNHGAYCDHCADGMVGYDAAEEAAWLAFRNQVDAAEAAELARIRKKLKLTQLEAAHLAGGGKNAFSRYERGHTKPLAAVINLFRLLDRHPELLNDLRAG